jgi:hypothetical protein
MCRERMKEAEIMLFISGDTRIRTRNFIKLFSSDYAQVILSFNELAGVKCLSELDL